MKFFIKKVLSLELWNLFDIQFGNMLVTSAFHLDKKTAQYHKKKWMLMLASTYLSANVRFGHTCLPLFLLTEDQFFKSYDSILNDKISQTISKLSIDDWQELLLSTSAVGNGSEISPLVLEDQCLYLYRMWKDECIVSQFFNYVYNNSNVFQEKKIINILNQLFPKTTTISINWQKIATAISLIHPRVIISGGPGTGKTSVIHKIITALLLCNNKLRIKMVAPTGKAATILTNSCYTIPYDLNQLNNSQEYITIPHATTIHNLLGSRLYQTHNNLDLDILNLDYLIIDEASMMSLSLLSQLVLALPNTAKIILLGDHNQLYSIAPGSVFQDICQFTNINYSPNQQQKLTRLTGYIPPVINNLRSQYDYNNITDGTCILRKNYRFNEQSGIGKLAHAIKLGDYNNALSILTKNTYTDLQYIRTKNQKDYITMIMDCAIKYVKYLKMLQQHKISIISILETFNNYRILCALRYGPFGVIKLNYYIEQILHDKGLITLNNAKNYSGKPIMILRNDSSLGLMNGDIGILLPNNHNHLSAYFLLPQNTIKTIHIHQLPIHETCFAMTIHKSQGSEFQCISIILPNKHSPILTKELLYTAITRTHDQLFLYSTDDVLIRSINFSTKRYSGLYNKIKQNIQKTFE